MPTTDHPLDASPRFSDRGYLIAENLLTLSEVECLLAAFNEVTTRFAVECGVSPDRYREVVSQWTNLWRHHDAFARQLQHPRVAALARELLGCDDVRVFHDHVIYKPAADGAGEPRSGTVPWHQDYPYWPVDRPRAVSCWLALDDVTADSGAMCFMPGAHIEGEAPPVDFLSAPKSWGAREAEVEVVEVSAGSAIFHDCLTWHTTPRTRAPPSDARTSPSCSMPPAGGHPSTRPGTR